MLANHIHIYELGIDVSTQPTYDACIKTHLAINGYFATSINCCFISNGSFLISDIGYHQGSHIQKSAVRTDTNPNLIHGFNWTRLHQKTIEA